jgi:glutathione S-transferase
MTITLYYHPLASFCHKVLIALYEHGIDFEKRLINLGAAEDRAELASIWPICKFPVIRDSARGRDVPESSSIIEYLDHFYPGDAALVPQDWEAAHEVRLGDRFVDNYVQGPMQAIVFDRITGSQGNMERERTALGTAYQMIDQRMATRTWIAGDAFSMADCAAAPALFYAATVAPFPADARGLADYFERLVARPSVRRVLEEAKPYLSMYPFEESVPARFR